MKNWSWFFLTATRLLVVVMCLQTLSVQANTVLALKGVSSAAKYPDAAGLRLSVLSYNDAQSTAAFVERYQQYQQNHNAGSFKTFIKEQQTRGYLFSEEATGYTIKYAWQDPEQPDERMVFVVTPGLFTLNPYMWKTPDNDNPDFSVLELRIKGEQAIVKNSLQLNAAISEGKYLYLQDFGSVEPFAVLEDNTPYYLRQGS